MIVLCSTVGRGTRPVLGFGRPAIGGISTPTTSLCECRPITDSDRQNSHVLLSSVVPIALSVGLCNA